MPHEPAERRSPDTPPAAPRPGPPRLHPRLAMAANGCSPVVVEALATATERLDSNDWQGAKTVLDELFGSMRASDRDWVRLARTRVALNDLRTGPRLLAGDAAGLAAALAEVHSLRPERATVIWSRLASRPGHDLPDLDVPDGTVLTVRLQSAAPRLRVTSGRVVVQACATAEQTLEVHAGAALHVVTDAAGRQVVLHAVPAPGRPEPELSTARGQHAERGALVCARTDVLDLAAAASSAPTRRLVEVDTDFWGVPLSWSRPGGGPRVRLAVAG